MADKPVNRRSVLKGLGTVGVAAGLAGCGGGGGNGNGDGGGGGGGGVGSSGERVPTFLFEYWVGAGYTADLENQIPIIQDSWEEVGLDVEVNGIEYSAQVANMAEGETGAEAAFWYHYPSPDRLDPQELVKRWGIHRAGNTGNDNPANYANCEATDLSFQQQTASDPDQRRELVNEIQSIRSGDYYAAPTVPMPTLGAANNDTVELSNVGDQGVTNMNIPMIMNSSPVDGDTITIMGSQEGFVQTRNYLTIPALVVQVTYNNMLSSPVIGYDENYEQRNVLAESVETLDEGTRIRITLKDGATFQNGDPVTAEDVIFTYDVINSNLDQIPKSTQSPIDEYEVVDEKTADLILSQPSPPVYTRLLATWGILHKEAWEEAGARENLAENYPDNIPGSGPFSIGTFQQGQLMEFEPYDDHVFHTADHKVRFRFYSSNESAYQAFQEGELDIFQPVSQSYAQRIEENMDNATLEARDSFLPYIIYWQYNRPPTRYSEVRQALGMAINREEIAEVAFRNRVSPTLAAELMQDPHPFRAPDEDLTFYTDDPSGDIEGAKQVLEDEGWTFDDDGRLRYPDDLDPAYLWEPGETPSPDYFHCMNTDR